MPLPRHVLLVDGHADVRAVLAHVLVRLCPDATIAEAADGAEALSALAQQCPDLLISDYQMPIMGGLELVRTLRAQGATVPILVISSDPSIAEAVLLAGADAFLPKPFRVGVLTQLLRTLLPECEQACAIGQ